MGKDLAQSESTPTSLKTHQPLPSKLYKAYLNDPTLSDLKIQLSDRSVYAHRIVLCRGSAYFAKMLTGHFQVSHMPLAQRVPSF